MAPPARSSTRRKRRYSSSSASYSSYGGSSHSDETNRRERKYSKRESSRGRRSESVSSRSSTSRGRYRRRRKYSSRSYSSDGNSTHSKSKRSRSISSGSSSDSGGQDIISSTKKIKNVKNCGKDNEVYDWRDLVSNIKRAAECPVCLELLKPPVTMCINGHGTCSQCKGSLKLCPVCRKSFITTQPLILHHMLEKIPKKCKYSQYGCKLPVFDDHETYCRFREFECPLMTDTFSCFWEGSIDEWVKRHVKDKHSEKISYKTEEYKKIEYPQFKNLNNNQFVHLVDNEVFILYCQKKNGKFFQYMVQIPLNKPNKNYYFIIYFKDNSSGVPIYKYKLKPTVMITPTHNAGDIEKNVYCMSVPIDELNKLLDDKGGLSVTFMATCEDIKTGKDNVIKT